jgi:hypothetical protein
MGDERVPPMVDGQRALTIPTEHPAGRQKPPTEHVSIESRSELGALLRTNERIDPSSALGLARAFPRSEVLKRARIPPQGNAPRAPELSCLSPHGCVRMRDTDYHIRKSQAADFACP